MPVSPIGRHGGARNPIANDLKHVGIGVSVFLCGSGEIGTPATASGTQSVTESAIDAEFVLAGFGRFGIPGERISLGEGLGCKCQ